LTLLYFCPLITAESDSKNRPQINLFLAITVVKYLSIFVLKNPLGINSDFWNTLIAIVSTFSESSFGG
jgi:hypothetical protein